MGEILTTEQLAERHGVSPDAVRMWRYRGTGPKFFRRGRRVAYRLDAVVAWEKELEDAETARAS